MDWKRQKTPKNTAIYVSGLPQDTTTEEVFAFFSKCGIIMDEIGTGKPRVKLYCDDSGALKGDALIVYLREESVTLACTLLDESEFRPKAGKISVQPAQRDGANEKEKEKEQTDQNEAKRPKVDKETWKRHMKRMQKKLEWFDEDAEAAAKEEAKRARWAKIVVLKNMFTAAELEADPLGFPVQLSDEIVEECQERLGIEECSVQLVEEQPGVCTVKFKSELEAIAAVKLMGGRWFDGRRVEATIYDGSFALPRKKLTTAATATDDEEARLEQFSKFIEGAESASASEDEEDSEQSEKSDDEE